MLGVSFNTHEENAAFAAKYNFGFRLLSDTTHEVAAAYGACDDTEARYPQRMSFLIDAEGRIERIYDRVDPRDHAARVLVDVIGV